MIGEILSMIPAAVSAGNQIFGENKDQQDARQVKQQGILNKQAADLQYEQQMKMWQATNYKAQMDQLKQAGLNPALMYGKGGGGGATTGSNSVSAGQASNSAQTQTSNTGMGMAMAQIANTLAQTVKTVEETKNVPKTGENIEANTENTKTNTQQTNATMESIVEKVNWEMNKARTDFQQSANDATVKNQTQEAEIRRIREEAIGAALKNAVAEEEAKAIAARVTQGWEGLRQGDENIAINKFKTEFEANHPGVDKVEGGVLTQMIERIFKATGIDSQVTKIK